MISMGCRFQAALLCSSCLLSQSPRPRTRTTSVTTNHILCYFNGPANSASSATTPIILQSEMVQPHQEEFEFLDPGHRPPLVMTKVGAKVKAKKTGIYEKLKEWTHSKESEKGSSDDDTAEESTR